MSRYLEWYNGTEPPQHPNCDFRVSYEFLKRLKPNALALSCEIEKLAKDAAESIGVDLLSSLEQWGIQTPTLETDMSPEVTRAETLPDVLSLIEAHKAHQRQATETRFDGDTHSRSDMALELSSHSTIAYADSRRKRVQVELSGFRDGIGRKVIVWNAGDGVPPEVELLRSMAGHRVISTVWLEAMRIAMPDECFEDLQASVVNACRGAVCSVKNGMSHVELVAASPHLEPITWTMKHGDAFGEVTVVVRPKIEVCPRGIRVECSFALDVEDAHDDVEQFRLYVGGMAWEEHGARLVFAQPKELVGMQETGNTVEVSLLGTGAHNVVDQRDIKCAFLDGRPVRMDQESRKSGTLVIDVR